MRNFLWSLLGILLGSFIGATINMSIILLQPYTIPLPEGTNVSSMESLAKSMLNFEPKHFIMPFLAHSLGTLVGAFIASIIAKAKKQRVAIIIGGIFFYFGYDMVKKLPSPLWFNILDLVVAYLPMALLGYYLGRIVIQKITKQDYQPQMF